MGPVYTPFDHQRLLPLPFMYTPVLWVVPHSIIDAKRSWQPNYYTGIDASIMEVSVLRIQFVYSLFYAIYPKLLKLFYPTLLPIFHRNISPLLSNHFTMARTKTLKPSIIKTRSQSRISGTTSPTGTNDDTAAPAPVTTGRTAETIN